MDLAASTLSGAPVARSRSRSRRRVIRHRGLAHIEVKRGHHPELEHLRSSIGEELRRLEGVRWVEVNAVVGEVVVSFEDGEVDVDDLIELVEGIEDAHGLEEEGFSERVTPHPDDPAAIRRATYSLAADVVGMPLAFTRLLPRAPFAPHVAAVLGFVDHQPRLRKAAERAVGAQALDAGLAVGGTVALILGQGPLSLTLDALIQLGRLQEQRAVRDAWRRRRGDLLGRGDVPAIEYVPRPARLPSGPVEQWVDLASVATLTGFVVSLPLLRSLSRSADIILAGAPKGAKVGREAFAGEVARHLAAGDSVVLDPEVLRVLDRLDTVLVDADLLVEEAAEVRTVRALEGGDARQLRRAVSRLLRDPEGDAGFLRLAPVTELDEVVVWPRGAKAESRRLRANGLTMGLVEGERVVGLAALGPRARPGAEALVAAGRSAGLELVAVGGSEQAARRMAVDARVPNRYLADEVRRRQAEGRVVAVVTANHRAALRASDLGIGVHVPGGSPPWGADVVVDPDLVGAAFLLHAAGPARRVSAQSAALAMAGSVVGVTTGLAGPRIGATARTLLAVNSAALLALGIGTATGRALRSRTRSSVPAAPPA